MRNFPEADWDAPGPSHPPSRVWVLPSGGEQCDGTAHGDTEAEAEQKSGRWAGKVEASPRAGGHGVNGTGTWGGGGARGLTWSTANRAVALGTLSSPSLKAPGTE